MQSKTQFKTNIVERYENGESSYRISEDEGCSYNTVLRELKRRGINTGRMYWTEEEIIKIEKLYPIASNKRLLKEFPKRSIETIRYMAGKLRVKKVEYKSICEDCRKEFTIKPNGISRTKGFCSKCVKKQWEHNHLKEGAIRKKQWRQRNPEYVKQYAKTPKARENTRRYFNQRRKDDPKFRLNQAITNCVCKALRGKKAGKRWEILVGYTLEDMVKHLEKKFDEKMSWENWGNYWHIDHIKPKSLFKYTSPDEIEFKKCWALENLQPLEKFANIKKGDKFIS